MRATLWYPEQALKTCPGLNGLKPVGRAAGITGDNHFPRRSAKLQVRCWSWCEQRLHRVGDISAHVRSEGLFG